MDSWKQRMIGKENHRRQVRRGRNKHNESCKKHPKHEQSPGVCSICLNQKLSKISNSPSCSKDIKKKYYNYHSSASSSSYLSSVDSSSNNASSCSSPVFNYTCHVDVLKKSKSMAFVLRRRREDDSNNGKNVKVEGSSKEGFWSKLRNKGLMRSRTMREG